LSLALLERRKAKSFHVVMNFLAVLVLDSADPVMDFVNIMPALGFGINRTFLPIPDSSIADHLEGVVCSVGLAGGIYSLGMVRDP
jgi:hypothetical protein